MPKTNTQSYSTTSMKQAWRWCSRCERAFLSYSNNTCRYKGCDGSDILDWDDFRAENPSYPETPTAGHTYRHIAQPEES